MSYARQSRQTHKHTLYKINYPTIELSQAGSTNLTIGKKRLIKVV